MNYCSHCGSDALEFTIPEGDNRPRYQCRDCGAIHYQNPKAVVGCLPVYQGRILLCKRAIEPREGFWNLPAGYLENGETLEIGAIRETWEEAQAEVNLIRLHCVYDLPKFHQFYLFFLGEIKDGVYGVGEESLESALFAPEEIPYEEMAFPSSTFAIRKYLAHLDTGFEGVHIGSWP